LVSITADKLAHAMQDNVYYPTYGQATLLVEGQVNEVSLQGGNRVIELVTDIPTRVLCDIGSQSTGVKSGDFVTVRSEIVLRQGALVWLKPCSVVP
jgi:hypothetical protein